MGLKYGYLTSHIVYPFLFQKSSHPFFPSCMKSHISPPPPFLPPPLTLLPLEAEVAGAFLLFQLGGAAQPILAGEHPRRQFWNNR